MTGPERRQTPRTTVEKFVYINIEPNNGGSVLNVSERGLCFHSIAPVQAGRTIRFWFSEHNRRIEVDGELAWTDETRKTGGLRFIALPAEAREPIRNWITASTTIRAGDEAFTPSVRRVFPVRSAGLSGTKTASGSSEVPAAVVSSKVKVPAPLRGFSGGLATGLFVAAVVAAAFFFLALAMRREPLAAGFPAAAAATFGFVDVAVPLAMLVQLRQQGSGAFLILYLLIVVWMGDTVAYYTGRALGRHKLAPRISPGKTWEGTLGSLVGAIVCGTLVFAYSRPISSGLISAGLLTPGQAYLPPLMPPLWHFAALSAAINVAAQIGDLAESLIKRGAGVKDSGTILPGHGGMLDRIDALLFAAPVLWYYAAWRVLG